jgi:predicted nucleic acid-binding Zn ribbon protein
LKLEREGYSPEELRIIAEMEEWYIDNLWAADEMAYLDDDLETMISFHSERAEAFTLCDPAQPEQADKIRKQVQRLRDFQVGGIPDKLRSVVEKDAFRARAWNEMMRVTFLKQERDKVLAGYSPFVSLRSWSYGMGAMAGFTAGEVNWTETVKAALTYTKDEDLPSIRVSGVLLRGDLVTPTRTLRPSEYEALWKERDVEGYLQAWSKIRGEPLCLNCFAPLPPGNERKKFCTEKCRNALKQRRYKERNPEAVLRSQEKYWSS